MKYEVPIWEKSNLTLEEAAAYSGIGINKLREITNEPGCKFVFFIGKKVESVECLADGDTAGVAVVDTGADVHGQACFTGIGKPCQRGTDLTLKRRSFRFCRVAAACLFNMAGVAILTSSLALGVPCGNIRNGAPAGNSGPEIGTASRQKQ